MLTNEERCPAVTFVRDDRMGGWTNRCERPRGHGGLHTHVLGACEPVAEMTWDGTYEPPVRAPVRAPVGGTE